MKRFTLLTFGVAVVATSAVSIKPSQSLWGDMMKRSPMRVVAGKSKVFSKNESGKDYKARAKKVASLWRAQTQKGFGWDGEEWELMETHTLKFNDQGLAVTELTEDPYGGVGRETYTWNENRMMTSRISEVAEEADGEYFESGRLFREYDSRVVDFITKNDQQANYGDEWRPANSYTQTITRNADGNVTQMERAVWFNGDYDPTYRIVVEYGEDGKASTISAYDLTYDYASAEYEWVLSERYSDIVWENTDGQIVQVDDLFTGTNRIKSAVLNIEGEEAQLSVGYTGEDFVASISMTEEEMGMEIEVFNKLSYRVLDLDEAGSAYGQHGFEYVTESTYSEDGEILMEEVIAETYIYDSNDLIVLEKVEDGDREESYIVSLIEGEIEYDETHGYPLSWTVSEYDYDSEEMFYSFRAEYSDYVDIAEAGINGVEAAPADDTTTSYYNLQGERVANPSTGIFIRVKGGKADKIVL